jgi:hypothetical protein
MQHTAARTINGSDRGRSETKRVKQLGRRQPITAQANVAPISIPALCARAQALLAEIGVISKDHHARHDRAEAKLGGAPREISVRVLRTSADFDCIDKKTRTCEFGDGVIPVWVIESAIKEAEGITTCELIEHTAEAMTIRSYSKPQRRKTTAEQKARSARLRKLLDIARDRSAKWKALLAEEGYVDDDPRSNKLTDQVNGLINKIAAMRSKTSADVLAKLALFNLDPDWFSDAGPGKISLAQSIFRDVPDILGGRPGPTELGDRSASAGLVAAAA